MNAQWVPILFDDDATEAERSVLEVAKALDGGDWSAETLHPGLSGGNAGLALFFHELSHRWPEPEFKLRRDKHWDAAIDGLAKSEFIPPSLYGGFTGVGWATALLSSVNSGVENSAPDDESHEELEETLLEFLVEVPTPADYDLISGPVGWGLYALERWPHPRAIRALELIVDFLADRADRVPQGARWWTAPELLPQWQRERAPNGYYNLGLSHGIPGICVLLSQALARRVRPDVCGPLLEQAVEWVLAQRIGGIEGLSFPSAVIEGTSPTPSRLAWCYGDLGVAAALWVVGDVSGNRSWSETALSIARRATATSPEASGAVDAGICHGTSGIGHIFNRFYQATGDSDFGTAARAWMQRTLKMRQTGIGPGGYAAWRIEPTRGWAPTPGLLEGSAGIGLTLLAATGNREPLWDRFLFVSPVPVQAVRSEAGDAK